MATQERKICRLCLKICNKFKALDGDTKGVLDIILPNIKLTTIQEPVMCTDCTETLSKCFDFKTECIYTRDYIAPFVNNKDAVKLDLKNVYLSKNEDCTGISEDQDICGFCMGSVKNCFAIFPSVEKEGVLLQKIIRQCLPELDLSIIKKPVICRPCHGSLETYFRFVMNCLSVEDKIRKYCETLDVDSKDRIKLSHLLEFTVRDITTGEADGNLVHVIKEEKQLCEERGYVDDLDNVIFKKEEGFIPENVSACKEESKNLDVIEVERGGVCEENNFLEEKLEKMEDQKCLLNEEIEIKTEESDFCRHEDSVASPRPEVATRLCVSKSYIKQKLIYKCASCSFQTKQKQHLNKHLLVHKDPLKVTMYKYASCFYETKYKNNLKGHLLKHKDPSEVTTYKCDSCSYQTIYKGNLKCHSRKHKDPSEVIMYKCDSCSFQTKYRNALVGHLLVHKDPLTVTMFKCDSCSFQTKHRGALGRHLLVHKDPLKVTMFKCGSCSFQTKHNRSLKMHLVMHKDRSEVTMYECDSCSFQTKQRQSLSRHLLVHKDPLTVTMFKCDSCSFQTKYRMALSRHLLEHHKDPLKVTMYKCDSCWYQTMRKDYLKYHSQKHKDPSEVTIYKCESCSFQTKYRNSHKRHLRVHNDPFIATPITGKKSSSSMKN